MSKSMKQSLFMLFFFLFLIEVQSVCNYGWYADVNGTCQACSVIPGCLNCTSQASCKLCAQGFFINSTELCQSCPIGCEGCFSSSFCTSCVSGYYIQSNNTCQPCGANCQTCLTQNSCLSCPGGMVLNGTSCIACSIDHCVYCIQNSASTIQCAECALGYYASSTTVCSACSSVGCASCNATDNCLSCQLGYYLETNGTCVQCGPKCSQCTTSATACDSCVLGYYLVGSNCEPCSDHPGCLVCENNTYCLECSQGYYRNGSNVCLPCDVDDCDHCEVTGVCLRCNYGFVLTNSGLNCDECSSQVNMQGCLSCFNTSVCEVCDQGFFLSNDNCTVCSKGCASCQNATYCNQCTGQFTWSAGSCNSCEDNVEGCSFCNQTGGCLICQSDYFMNGTDNLCYSCREQMTGCRACNSSAGCEICSDGFWLDVNDNDKCKPCSESLEGCSYCSSNVTCLGCHNGYYLGSGDTFCTPCNSGNAGCLACNNTGDCWECESGYFLDVNDNNLCKPCQNFSKGCIFCSAEDHCEQCQGGYYLSNQLCVQCSLPGCEICDQGNSSKCITCNSFYYHTASKQCSLCNTNNPGCLVCTDDQNCQICESGYFQVSGKCKTCAEVHHGCLTCNSSLICTLCESMFYLDVNNQCQLCQKNLTGCANCENQNNCTSCLSGFYLENDTCIACTELPGCTFCSDKNTCLSCDKGFYLDNDKCLNCSLAIGGCLSCLSSIQCIKCEGGFSLDKDNLCQASNIAVPASSASTQQSIKFRTQYISNQTLIHYLLAVEFNLNRNIDLTKVDWNSNAKISVQLGNGTIIDLVIKMAEWKDNQTIIFYTDNPLNLQESDLQQMPFARRRLESSLHTSVHTSIQLSEELTRQLMPDYNHVGPLSIDYSLDDAEFYTSYLKIASESLLWIIGMVITVLLLIVYTIKACFTVPNSMNLGHIIPHIFALKAGALILYPTYREYINYCTGFMTADLPWLNDIFGGIFGNDADTTPSPYKVFFTNLNIGSTYFLAFITILVIGLILFAIAKLAKKQERIYPFFQVFYSFFVFGVIFAGCISFQGAILNPIQELTANGFFYILGIAMYFASLIEVCYSLKVKGRESFWKIRVFLKATLLSLCHWSPVYLIAATLFVDVILIIVEYKLCIYSQVFMKSWIIAHICANVALVLVVFAPTVIISLLFVTLFIVASLVLESYMHYKEYKGEMKDHAIEKESRRQDTESNLWELNMANSTQQSKIFNIYNNDLIDEKFRIQGSQQKKAANSSDSSQKDSSQNNKPQNQSKSNLFDNMVAIPKTKSKTAAIRSKLQEARMNKTKVVPKQTEQEQEKEKEEEISMDQNQMESFVFEEQI